MQASVHADRTVENPWSSEARGHREVRPIALTRGEPLIHHYQIITSTQLCERSVQASTDP